MENNMRKITWGKLSPEYLKVSKLGLWWDSFVYSWKYLSLKFTGELGIQEELTWQFKIDKRNLTNFDLSTWKSQKFSFNGLPLTKVYNAWAKKVQESYVWWHWILMQNLKETDFCFQKWHEEFGKFSTDSLERLNWDFDGILLPKVENVWA